MDTGRVLDDAYWGCSFPSETGPALFPEMWHTTTIPGPANWQNHVKAPAPCLLWLTIQSVGSHSPHWATLKEVISSQKRRVTVTPGTTRRELKLASFRHDEMGVSAVCKKDGMGANTQYQATHRPAPPAVSGFSNH